MCRHRVSATFERIAQEIGVSVEALELMGAAEVIRMRRRG